MKLKHGQSVLVLVNPISGRGEGGRLAPRLAGIFTRLGLESEIHMLTGPGAAEPLVRDRACAHGAVVAVGGDGTINEVAGAVFTAGARRPIGLIPLGLSNCLARHFGLPSDPQGAAEVIAGGAARPWDVALAGHRIILSFMGAGFDAAVVEKVAGQRKGPVRNLTYVEAFGSSLLDYRWNNLEVEVDGQELDGRFSQALMSAVTNYAHFFQLPSASGFQVYLFRMEKRTDLILSLLHMGWKRRLDRACDAAFPVRKAIEIRAVDGQGVFQFDGEAGGPLPVSCTIEAGALEFLTP